MLVLTDRRLKHREEVRAKRELSKRIPKFKLMSDAAKAVWYMRIDQIKKGKQKTYRHHPLDETALFVPK